jgi:pimeloyl-ACP methyl ester carboxylesterase
MNPFFFGDTVRPLYGVHHAPRGTTARSAGVLLCYPFAREYIRAHRAFRQLSLLLSGEGFHVLRFDYSGTGDSAGDPPDMSLRRWDEDVSLAIEELIDTAAVETIWVVGLRLGGALALRAAAQDKVDGIVLWDPVIIGKDLLREAHPLTAEAAGASIELGGVPIPVGLQNEIDALDLITTPVPRGRAALLAVSEDSDHYRKLEERLSRDGMSIEYKCVPSDGRWSEFDNWGSALIPQALIRTIVDYLKLHAS